MSILDCLQNFDRINLPKFDFHLHTSWTDGENTVKEMHETALKEELSHILYSEHVRSTSEDWFTQFANEVRELDRRGCQAFVGMETKIKNFQGELDVTPSLINQCDLVMASVHRFPGEEGIVDKNSKQFKQTTGYDNPIEIEFQLANLILENPQVHILGHPFGMSYKRFGLTPPRQKIIQLIKKAAQTGVAFEINTRYHPDLHELIDLCRKYGAMISFGSNAHSIQELGNVQRRLKEEVGYAVN